MKERATARAAVDLIGPGTTVMFDASTAALAVACELPLAIELTAVVNALHVALELSRCPNVNLILIGGTLEQTSFSFSGPTSESCLGRLYAHTAFTADHTLALGRGSREAEPNEFVSTQLMAAHADRVVTLIDSSTLDGTTLRSLAPLAATAILITDDAADAEVLDQVRLQGVEVRVASPALSCGSFTPRRQQVPNKRYPGRTVGREGPTASLRSSWREEG